MVLIARHFGWYIWMFITTNETKCAHIKINKKKEKKNILEWNEKNHPENQMSWMHSPLTLSHPRPAFGIHRTYYTISNWKISFKHKWNEWVRERERDKTTGIGSTKIAYHHLVCAVICLCIQYASRNVCILCILFQYTDFWILNTPSCLMLTLQCISILSLSLSFFPSK